MYTDRSPHTHSRARSRSQAPQTALPWTQYDVQEWLRGLDVDERDVENLTATKDGPLRNGAFAMRATHQNVADACSRRGNEQSIRVVQDALNALQRAIPRHH